jgi:hypothetical protein
MIFNFYRIYVKKGNDFNKYILEKSNFQTYVKNYKKQW